jgi:hypothetical protein
MSTSTVSDPLHTVSARARPRPMCDSRHVEGDGGVMAWRCGKCDGANVPAHSPHRPRRAELHQEYVAGSGLPPKVQPQPGRHGQTSDWGVRRW